jgi:hypothetical protein
MKRIFLSFLIIGMSLISTRGFSQKDSTAGKDTTLLGLPGDNLDLYATLDLFQKSKTIEEFEKNLNLEKTGINNLDLNLDKKVDFIKVVTKKDGDNFTFILQVDVAKNETQDVAVILVSKDKDKKITMQIVGDKDLYGKDYIVELKESKTPSVTPNPGYTGTDTTIVVAAPAKTTVVVVEQAPIVQYVYSPAYVPYAPPYYYGYYPPYFALATCIAIGIYRSNCYGYHGGYYGGHYGGNNTVIINNKNNFNNYNNNKMRSNTVSDNKARGGYGSGSANRPGGGPSASTRPSTSNRPGGGPSASTRPSTSNGVGGGPSASTRQSSSSNRQSPSASTRQSSPSYSPSSSSRSRSSSGGGRSMGGGF